MYKIISLIVIFPLIIFADWQSLNGPSGGRADDMSMGEYQSEWIIYAADNTYKLYKSDDEGASWQQITHQDIAQPQGVVTDPSDARVVYICKWVSYDNSAIWKSIDGGINWDWVDDNNLTNKHMRCMAIDADRPETLYVAGDSYKNPSNEEQPSVFKSYDGGQNWIQEKIRAVHWPDPYICDISVVSDDLNSIVLAASYEVGFLTSPGVFRKVNEGPWTHAELPYNIGAVALGDMQYAYAGIREGDPGFFRSDDGGDTWEQVFEFPSTYVYDIETRAPFHVWVATADGIYESTDRGATWEPKNDYVLCKYCRHVLVHPDEPNDLFVGANWALYKTTNMGENWFEITNGYPLAKLASVASNDPYIYCLGEAILLGVESSSIFRSPGYGSTWQTLTGAFDTEVTPVAIDVRPSNSSIVLFGGNTVISPPEQDSKGVIFRSNNYGETWSERYRPPTQMSPDNIHALEFCPVNDNRVFAGYDGYPPSSYPIKRSNNTGDTWHQISIPQNPPVYDFCPNPQDNSIIYAGTKQKGVYKSEDDGDNWTQTELDDVDVNALAVDFDFPDTLYAGSADPTGIYTEGSGDGA